MSRGLPSGRLQSTWCPYRTGGCVLFFISISSPLRVFRVKGTGKEGFRARAAVASKGAQSERTTWSEKEQGPVVSDARRYTEFRCRPQHWAPGGAAGMTLCSCRRGGGSGHGQGGARAGCQSCVRRTRSLILSYRLLVIVSFSI